MKQMVMTIILIVFGVIVNGQNSLVWSFDCKYGIYSSPVADSNNIFFGSNDSVFYALDKKSGTLKWKFKTNGQIKSKPALHIESVIVNSSDGNVYSFDKKNGRKLWMFETKGEKTYDLWDYYLSSPIVSNNTVYVGSGDGSLYAIDANTGKMHWSYDTGDVIHATPAISDQKVFVGSFNGNFYALDCISGALVWKFKTVGDRYFPKGEIQKGAVVFNNSIIFGSRDYNIYSLDMNTGRGLWNMKEIGSWVIATPYLYQNDIFFGTSDTHRFYSMNADNGNINWTLPLNMRVYCTAKSFKDKIYFGCFNGKLFGVNSKTGEIEYIFQTNASKVNYSSVYQENGEFLEGFQLYDSNFKESEKKILDLGSILSDPLIEDGVVYFGDSKGSFYALHL